MYAILFLNTLSRLPLPRSPHLQRLTESASVREGERVRGEGVRVAEMENVCVGLDEIIFFNLPQVQVHEPTNYNFNAVACLRIPFFLSLPSPFSLWLATFTGHFWANHQRTSSMTTLGLPRT